MAVTKDTLIMDLLMGTDTISPAFQRLAIQGDKVGKLNAIGIKTSDSLNELAMSGQFTSKEMELIGRQADQTTQKMKTIGRQFDMNSLSWLFGGMAMQRMGLSLTRFLIPSLERLEQLNTEGAKKVYGVVAAFEFLKITLFETLMSLPLFNDFIELIIKGAIWAAEFAQEHPAIVAIAAAIAGIMTTLGTIAMGIGIFMQFKHILILTGIFEGALTTIGAIIAGLTLPIALLGGLALLAGLSFLAALAFEESRAKLVEIWSNGGGAALQNLLDRIGELFGWSLNVSDIFKYLASIGVWAFAILNLGIEGMIDSLTFAVDIIKLIVDTLSVLADPNFSLSTLGDTLKSGFKTIYEDANRAREESTSLDEVLKGPVGLYKEMFSPEMAENAGTVTEAINLQTSSFDNMGIALDEDLVSFNNLTTSVDAWTPATKYVNIYYNHINQDGSGSTSTSGTSRESSSSITG